MSVAAVVVAGVALVASFAATTPGPAPGPAPGAPLPPAPAPGDPLDRALGGERSLLAFLPPEVTSGTFTITPATHGRPAPRHRGVFWRTRDGNVYTRTAPYDAALVAREVDALTGRLRAVPTRAAATPGPREASREELMPLLAGEPYRGDEFQYPFEYLVFELVLRASHGNGFVRTYDDDCDLAMTAHERAARAAVAATPANFVRTAQGAETWTLDVVALRRATRETRHATELACDTQRDAGSPDEGPAVRVARSARGVTVTVDGYSVSDLAGRHVVAVRPGPVGPPPSAPRPESAFAPVPDFLLAVNACRGLPWEYSNFMAGNDYTPPHHRSYHGPTPFTFDWYCDRDVKGPDRED